MNRMIKITITPVSDGMFMAETTYENGNHGSVHGSLEAVKAVVGNWMKVAGRQERMTYEEDAKKRREEDKRKNREDEDRRRREQELMNVNTAIVTTLLTGE